MRHTEKKRILIITQCFPPHGGSGVQRPLFFSKYLSEFGWECIILTTEQDNYPIHDESLKKHIHETTKIIRVNCPPISEKLYNVCERIDRLIGKILSRAPYIWKYSNILSKSTRILLRPIIRFLSIPDDIVGNLPKLVGHGFYVALKQKPDIILSTSPPPTMHLTGLTLSKLTGIPWVLDLRDEWTLNPFMQYPTRFYQKYDQFLERLTLKHARRIISTTDPIALDTAKITRIEQKKFITITNGHTLDENVIRELKRSSPDKNQIIFTHSGTLLKDRSPSLWIDAFEKFINNTKNKNILLNFAGDTKHFKSQLNRPWINQLGYLEHQACLRKLAQSNVLLLIGGPLHKRCYPGKIFEYLAMGKPILTICPVDSAIYAFLQGKDHCYLADIDDPSSIAHQLSIIYNLWKQNNLPFWIDRPERDIYYRRKLAKKLDTTLRGLLKTR